MESVESLVARLQKANWAYNNGGDLVMTDDEYDRQLEELKRRSPAHPFLSVIGAPPADKSVLLPHTMASLNKIRYGEGTLARWVQKFSGKQVICTEKLDGLSAVVVTSAKGKQSLYLRGDGVRGVDVSRALGPGGLRVPSQVPGIVRGEVLLPNESTPAGSIGRSLVNGYLHRCLDVAAPIPPELASCHFVAYQILSGPGSEKKRSEQLATLKAHGFRIPQILVFKSGSLNEESAKEVLTRWRSESAYPLDGIVLGVDSVPQSSPGGEARNPEDAVAFKASLEEQKRETSIVHVEWNLSRQGMWIPTLVIEPVEIGGARITRLSAHNAATVEKGGLGPGTRIIVRRSGDVIPTLDTVLSPAPGGAQMPEEGAWIWDTNHVHAQRSDDSEVGGSEAACKAIQHCLTTLGVEGVGPGLVKKMVESGLNTMKKVCASTADTLGSAIGAGRGAALYASLQAAVQKANQMTLLIASNLLPRGVGERKLRTLYAKEADAKKWTMHSLGGAAGWSDESLSNLLAELPKAFAWITETFGAEPHAKASTPTPAEKGPMRYVVFTGCRVKELPAGWEMEDSVTKKTSLLVVADDAIDKETTKTKKAKAQGVEIITLTKFKSSY